MKKQILALKSSQFPAFPIAPDACDGECVELTIFGESSEIKISWWTIVPKGAEGTETFSRWLRLMGEPTKQAWR